MDSLFSPKNKLRPAPATQLPAHATIIVYRNRYVKPPFCHPHAKGIYGGCYLIGNPAVWLIGGQNPMFTGQILIDG
jgi:hypothetical protein